MRQEVDLANEVGGMDKERHPDPLRELLLACKPQALTVFVVAALGGLPNESLDRRERLLATYRVVQRTETRKAAARKLAISPRALRYRLQALEEVVRRDLGNPLQGSLFDLGLAASEALARVDSRSPRDHPSPGSRWGAFPTAAS